MPRPLVILFVLATFGCSTNRTPAGGVDGGLPPLECLPNLDGRIDPGELPVAIELAANYYVRQNASVNLSGDAAGESLVWRYPDETADDARVAFAAAAVLDQWYAEDFPDATFALATDARGDINGIYRKDNAGLWLLGLASTEPDPPGGRTLFRYQSPVAVLRFPIQNGDRYTEVGEIVGGTVNGLPYAGTDTYEIVVDGSGELVLPYVSFSPVLRVYTYVRSEPTAGGVSTSRRQVSFLFECFGEVARATSQPDETNPNFSTAAELRRFAL